MQIIGEVRTLATTICIIIQNKQFDELLVRMAAVLHHEEASDGEIALIQRVDDDGAQQQKTNCLA